MHVGACWYGAWCGYADGYRSPDRESRRSLAGVLTVLLCPPLTHRLKSFEQLLKRNASHGFGVRLTCAVAGGGCRRQPRRWRIRERFCQRGLPSKWATLVNQSRHSNTASVYKNLYTRTPPSSSIAPGLARRGADEFRASDSRHARILEIKASPTLRT